MNHPQAQRWRRRMIAALLVAVLAGSLYLLRVPALTFLGEWLNVGQPPIISDCVMVLPGDPNTRPFVAAALFRAGLAPSLVTSKAEAAPNIELRVIPPEHELIRRVLLLRGVPESAITILDGNSTSTFDDAQALARWLDHQPMRTLTVVTSDHHTRRARWVFHHVLGQKVDIHMVSAPKDGVRADNWWRMQNGFSIYLSEYVKLAYYVFRYGDGLYWFCGLVVLAIALQVWRVRWRTKPEGVKNIK